MFQETVTNGFVRGFSGGLVDTAPYVARAYSLTADAPIASVVSLVSDETVTAGVTNIIGVIFNQRSTAGSLGENSIVRKGSVEILEAGRFYLELASASIGDTLYATNAGVITLTATGNTALTKFKVVSDTDANGICIIEIDGGL